MERMLAAARPAASARVDRYRCRRCSAVSTTFSAASRGSSARRRPGWATPATSRRRGPRRRRRGSCRSPGRCDRETPTSMTTAPGLIDVRRDDPRHARGRDDDVGVPGVLREVLGARVRERHGRVDPAAGEQQPDRAADGDPAADDDDVRPARSMSCRSSRSMMPRGVHGSGECTGSLTRRTRRPRLVGCSPSASLSGSTSSSTRLSSMPFGSGSCTMNPVHSGSSLSRGPPPRSRPAWPRPAGPHGSRRCPPRRSPCACRRRTARAGVVADEQRAQPGHDAAGRAGRRPVGQLGLDRPRRWRSRRGCWPSWQYCCRPGYSGKPSVSA